jgi:hypothetical protein
MFKGMKRMLRNIAKSMPAPDDTSGAKKNRHHRKKGPGRMPYRRGGRA